MRATMAAIVRLRYRVAMRNSPFPAALALACTLLAGTPARAVDTKLPDMGSSAASIASPEEQRQYGFYVLHELRNQGMVLDDALLTWRHKHVLTVERIIGGRPGTGGTEGVGYLAKTLTRRCFPELWSLRTRL